MTHRFDDSVVSAVLHHMNDDHRDDNLLIARAFSPGAEITASTMTGFDGSQGEWRVTLADGGERDLSVPWPSGPISERPEVRREIVALYDESCRRLGVEPRPHA